MCSTLLASLRLFGAAPAALVGNSQSYHFSLAALILRVFATSL
jgi:hypothetical protein